MKSSMVVAFSRATVDGRTLVGHNHSRPANEPQALVRTSRQEHAPGEDLVVGNVLLPQVRRTWAVLGGRPARAWGYVHGVNECGLALATTTAQRRLTSPAPGLNGQDLVRLVLERAASARQGVDLACDLIGRFGQGSPESGDCNLLIADAREAYLLAAAGSHWAMQEIQAVRAVTGVTHLRQDWDRISRGLCDVVIERGWWPEDGSKLDFEGTVSAGGASEAVELRRWGHATLLLEDQNGHIDSLFLRRLLSDHYEGCLDEADPVAPCASDNSLCLHSGQHDGLATAASFLIECAAEAPPLAWCAFGPPCASVYFPLVLDGDLPAEFTGDGPGAIDSVWQRMVRWSDARSHDPAQRGRIDDALIHLQEYFDQAAEDYAEERARLSAGDDAERHHLATAFMRHNFERFEDAWVSALEGLAVESEAGRPMDRGVAALPV
jgi:dipeptidase